MKRGAVPPVDSDVASLLPRSCVKLSCEERELRTSDAYCRSCGCRTQPLSASPGKDRGWSARPATAQDPGVVVDAAASSAGPNKQTSLPAGGTGDATAAGQERSDVADGSLAGELSKLHDLKLAGALSTGEYKEAKRQVLARRERPSGSAAQEPPAPSAASGLRAENRRPSQAEEPPSAVPAVGGQPRVRPRLRSASLFTSDAEERHAAWTQSAVKKFKWAGWGSFAALLAFAAIAATATSSELSHSDAEYDRLTACPTSDEELRQRVAETRQLAGDVGELLTCAEIADIQEQSGIATSSGDAGTPPEEPTTLVASVEAEPEYDPYATSGRRALRELEAGACIVDRLEQGAPPSVVSFDDCSQDHYVEVYEVSVLPDGDYPGARAIEAKSDAICSRAFEELAYIARKDSVIDSWHYPPTAEQWAAGDRRLLCIAQDPLGGRWRLYAAQR